MQSYDLKAYKQSKVYCEHIEAILRSLHLAEKCLTHFKVYTSVQKILSVIEDEKRILQIHYEKYKKIKETKGKV